METKPIYKTADELGIKQWEKDGLVALVGPLSRGELEVDMHCSTAACIGGLVSIHACRELELSTTGHATPVDDSSRKLRPLYWPRHESNTGAWRATAQQAARAIVNFLVTGDPQWDRVMSEPT